MYYNFNKLKYSLYECLNILLHTKINIEKYFLYFQYFEYFL